MTEEHMERKTAKSEPSFKYYKQAKKIIEKRMIFFFHFSLFIILSLMLFMINWINFKQMWWAQWPIVFWAIVIIGHFCDCFVFFDRGTRNPMQREKYHRRTAFYVHLIIYVLSNLVLLFINLHFTPAHCWALYPICGWGVGLFYHFFFVYVFKGWTIKHWKQSRTIKFMKEYYGIDPFNEKKT
ncbi:2TM domain-containing protein [bacterium]|nr:2TM domain-containing protein [bacterium]MCP5461857.1 2TM domain-containing protein [bacterium]